MTWVHSGLQLVEVINENYNEFVSLGSQLSGVEGAVLRIKKPMQDLQVSVFPIWIVVERLEESKCPRLAEFRCCLPSG